MFRDVHGHGIGNQVTDTQPFGETVPDVGRGDVDQMSRTQIAKQPRRPGVGQAQIQRSRPRLFEARPRERDYADQRQQPLDVPPEM